MADSTFARYNYLFQQPAPPAPPAPRMPTAPPAPAAPNYVNQGYSQDPARQGYSQDPARQGYSSAPPAPPAPPQPTPERPTAYTESQVSAMPAEQREAITGRSNVVIIPSATTLQQQGMTEAQWAQSQGYTPESVAGVRESVQRQEAEGRAYQGFQAIGVSEKEARLFAFGKDVENVTFKETTSSKPLGPYGYGVQYEKAPPAPEEVFIKETAARPETAAMFFTSPARIFGFSVGAVGALTEGKDLGAYYTNTMQGYTAQTGIRASQIEATVGTGQVGLRAGYFAEDWLGVSLGSPATATPGTKGFTGVFEYEVGKGVVEWGTLGVVAVFASGFGPRFTPKPVQEDVIIKPDSVLIKSFYGEANKAGVRQSTSLFEFRGGGLEGREAQLSLLRGTGRADVGETGGIGRVKLPETIISPDLTVAAQDVGYFIKPTPVMEGIVATETGTGATWAIGKPGFSLKGDRSFSLLQQTGDTGGIRSFSGIGRNIVLEDYTLIQEARQGALVSLEMATARESQMGIFATSQASVSPPRASAPPVMPTRGLPDTFNTMLNMDKLFTDTQSPIVKSTPARPDFSIGIPALEIKAIRTTTKAAGYSGLDFTGVNFLGRTSSRMFLVEDEGFMPSQAVNMRSAALGAFPSTLDFGTEKMLKPSRSGSDMFGFPSAFNFDIGTGIRSGQGQDIRSGTAFKPSQELKLDFGQGFGGGFAPAFDVPDFGFKTPNKFNLDLPFPSEPGRRKSRKFRERRQPVTRISSVVDPFTFMLGRKWRFKL